MPRQLLTSFVAVVLAAAALAAAGTDVRLADASRLPKTSGFMASRVLPQPFSLGEVQSVQVLVAHADAAGLPAEVADHVPMIDKRQPGAQRFSIDGFASVERRGNVDALLPSELAHDDDVFVLKALSDDLLYYGHERQNEVARPLQFLQWTPPPALRARALGDGRHRPALATEKLAPVMRPALRSMWRELRAERRWPFLLLVPPLAAGLAALLLRAVVG